MDDLLKDPDPKFVTLCINYWDRLVRCPYCMEFKIVVFGDWKTHLERVHPLFDLSACNFCTDIIRWSDAQNTFNIAHHRIDCLQKFLNKNMLPSGWIEDFMSEHEPYDSGEEEDLACQTEEREDLSDLPLDTLEPKVCHSPSENLQGPNAVTPQVVIPSVQPSSQEKILQRIQQREREHQFHEREKQFYRVRERFEARKKRLEKEIKDLREREYSELKADIGELKETIRTLTAENHELLNRLDEVQQVRIQQIENQMQAMKNQYEERLTDMKMELETMRNVLKHNSEGAVSYRSLSYI